jgi:perosamine synthetase
MKAIPRRTIAHYKGELRDIVGAAARGQLRNGPHIERFEKEFARYTGTKYAIAVGSGRLGLSLILESLQLDKNSAVMLPAYTDESVPVMIRSLGFEPVFVDIERDTHNIDADLIEGNISVTARVIIATHIIGRPCNLSKILETAERRGLTVIEDCAHSIGAEYRGRRVGSFGKAAYFSFGITKPFNTFGGGMITTDDPELYSRIREKVSQMDYPGAMTLAKNSAISLFLFFATLRPVFSLTVFPFLLLLSLFDKDLIHIYNKTVKRAIVSRQPRVKYTNMQALTGIRQLQSIDGQNEARRKNAALLMRCVEGGMEALKDSEETKPTYYFFVVLTRDAAGLGQKLLRQGIDTGKHIMRDCSFQYGKGAPCVRAGEAVRTSLQIPNHPCLSEADAAYIGRILNRESKNF